MSTINDYVVQSELALAAYGTFSVGLINDEQLIVKEVGMSISQATVFAGKWQVADHYNDPVTGVSATVFEEIATGAKHLAIRGTELTGKDILADGLLAAGLPSILNPQFTALQLKLNDVWLNDPAVFMDQSFTVSGHSLGGYLAAAVKQSYSQVTDAYLYNVPGLGGVLGSMTNAIFEFLSIAKMVDAFKFSNIEAAVSDGLNYRPIAGFCYDSSLSNHGHEDGKTRWEVIKPILSGVACLMMTIGLFFSAVVKAETEADESAMEQSAETRPVPYDFCGAQPWQKAGFCGRGQTGVGYTVCEAYLKHLNQSLPGLSVCEVPVPPKFKVPDWEEMDIHANLHLAYEAEVIRLSRYPWYEEIDFEVWKTQLLEEMETGQITPRIKKTRIAPTDKGDVTILAYSRDSERCQKGLAGLIPRGKSPNNRWSGNGYIHFILTEQDGLLEFQGQLPSLSTSLREMLLYSGKPYFMDAPGYGSADRTPEIYPKRTSVVAISNWLTKSNPSPDYLYTRELCQFMTIYNRIGDKRLEEEHRKNSKTDNPEGEKP